MKIVNYIYKINSLLFIPILAFLIFRGGTLELFDLSEPTEARYAAIGSDMLKQNNWVIPQFPRGMNHEPYLGKPPLYFIALASSQKYLGFDEWTARLPSFVATILTSISMFIVARGLGLDFALGAIQIFLSTAYIYFFSGAVMMDTLLGLFTTISLSVFYLLRQDMDTRKNQFKLIVFWLSLSLGFLVKGPIAAIFIFLPITMISILDRTINYFKILKIPAGLLVFSLICGPWFYYAEQQNPGFLKYFFVNENFLRFFKSEYGDRYGTGHRYPYGSVWWMYLLGLLPWSFYIFRLLPERKLILRLIKRNSDIQFFLSWALSIPLFLTFMKQLHPGYLVPAFPGMAFTISHLRLGNTDRESLKWDKFLRMLLIITVNSVFILAIFYDMLYLFDWGRLSIYAVFALLFTSYYFLKVGKLWSSFTSSSRLSDISFFILFIFFSSSIVFSKEISEKTSPTSIIRCIAKSTPQATELKLSFVGNKTFTAHYLSHTSSTELGKEISFDLVKEPIPEQTVFSENIVVKKKYSSGIDVREYKLMAEIEDYQWYSNTGDNIILSPDCEAEK